MDTEIMKKIDRALRLYVEKSHAGVSARAARQLQVSPALLNKWLKREDDKDRREPSLTKLGPFLDELGIQIIFPWETKIENSDCKQCEELEQKVIRLGIKNEALMEVIDKIKKPVEKESAMKTERPVSTTENQISSCLHQDDKMAI